MQGEPKHVRRDQTPLLCALPTPEPRVRGAGQEGWQTLVSALRGMPGEVRITHTKPTHTFTDFQWKGEKTNETGSWYCVRVTSIHQVSSQQQQGDVLQKNILKIHFTQPAQVPAAG